MTTEKLKSYTVKDLAQMAKDRGVAGWHDMRKDQLVRVLAKSTAKRGGKSKTRTAKKRAVATAKSTSPGGKSAARGSRRASKAAPASRRAASRPATKATRVRRKKPAAAETAQVARTSKKNGLNNGTGPPLHQEERVVARLKTPQNGLKINRMHEKMEREKNLAYRTPTDQPHGYTRDRLVVLVRDPFWLHATWELTRSAVQRAEAALAADWHMARPVLRLVEISNHGSSTSAETLVRNIPIHGGVNNWYVDVQDPPKTYRMDIGYLTSNNRFYSLARSNVVNTPRPGTSDTLDENWNDVAQQFDKIYAMSGGYSPDGPPTELQELFEERLRRPMGSPLSGNQSLVVPNGRRKKEFSFSLDAELIVYGCTDPTARVTLQGEPVQLRPDGTFTVRFSLPDSRQIIPAVARSSDGAEQRTIVLAVERNTKTMEPLVRENMED